MISSGESLESSWQQWAVIWRNRETGEYLMLRSEAADANWPMLIASLHKMAKPFEKALKESVEEVQ